MALLIEGHVYFSMIAIFEKLKCVHCKKYLSVFPVKVYSNRQVKCGRCSSDDENGTVSKLYEIIAQELKFPCINHYEGCNKLLEPTEVATHEKICLGTIMKCPICYDFEGHSLTFVEHFKQTHPKNYLKHPEFLIPFSDSFEEKVYLYADDLYYLLGIICVRYDNIVNMIDLDITPICSSAKNAQDSNNTYRQKFELYSIDNRLIYKSIEKRCTSYVKYDGPNFDNSIVAFIKERYPNEIAMCKFFIVKNVSVGFNKVPHPAVKYKAQINDMCKPCNLRHYPIEPIKIVEPCRLQHFPITVPSSTSKVKTVIKEVHIPCTLTHFPFEPVKVVKPCELSHFPEDYLMPIDANNHGCQTITYVFNDIYKLQNQDQLNSPIFYVGNTSWSIFIQYYKANNSYLSIFLTKEEYEQEKKYSYKVSADMELLKYSKANGKVLSLEKKIFGKRRNESMSWGCHEFIPWSILLDPKQNYVNQHNVSVRLKINLVDIFKHKDTCQCVECASEDWSIRNWDSTW